LFEHSFPHHSGSNAQVPSYVELQESLHKKAGIDEIIIYCVNDGAVMSAWADNLGVEHSEANDTDGMITFLGDPTGTLTRELDVELNHPGPASVGIIGRCKRFALFAVNGEVRYVAISEAEDDPAGDDDPSATLAPAIMDAIMNIKDEL
jgi:peroxiredoxin